MFEIIEGAPPPVDRSLARERSSEANRRRRKYPLEQLEIDQGFLVPHRQMHAMCTYVSRVGKAMGRKFTVRTVTMKQVKDTWQQCEATDPKAVTGVGVWRKG